MGKMTLEDVAREAGVSLATVDRVVNGRIGVHARTIERVNAAIKQLGFLPDPHASRLARGRDYDFRIILPTGENEFMMALGAEFRATRERQLQERVRLSIQHVDTFDGEALAAALERLPSGIDGVAVVALDHPAVTEAINALGRRRCGRAYSRVGRAEFTAGALCRNRQLCRRTDSRLADRPLRRAAQGQGRHDRRVAGIARSRRAPIRFRTDPLARISKSRSASCARGSRRERTR